MPVTKTGFEIVPEDFVSLNRKLEKMAGGKKIRMDALKEGGKVVREAVKESIDRIPDNDLRQSGKTRFKKSLSLQQSSNRKDFGEVVIGPAFSGKKYTAPDFHLFEFGTAERITKGGASRGRIEPLGMFRKGWEKSRQHAQNAVVKEIKRLLDV